MVRITRTIIKIIVIFIQLSFTLVSIIGTLSSVRILGNSNNIYIDPPILNVHTNGTLLDVRVPFGINNTGLYDFNELSFNISVQFQNKSDYLNSTLHDLGVSLIEPILAGDNYYNDTALSFYNIGLGSIDLSDWNVYLLLNLTSLYSLDLISFGIYLNMSLGVL